MAGRAARYVTPLLLLAASCVNGPTVPFSTDTPALALVPAHEAGIADRRGRFRAILCAITARDGLLAGRGCERALWHLADEPAADGKAVELGPARLPLHVVIDPGLGADCLAGIAQPFDDALGAVRAQGYAAELLPLGNLAGSAENAGRLRQTILALPEDGRPLIVIGYSRGATDGLEALATMPEVRARVVAFVAMAGTVNGSPLADHVLPAAANLLRFLPGATCELGDGRGVAELRPSFRLTRRMALPPISDLPLYSLVTFVDRAQVSPLLRPTWDVLARVDSRNDGQILAWDQILPGSALLGFLRADHLAAIAPVGPQLPWYVRGLLQGEDFPRAAVLEAVLRIVEEDLLARPGGKNASPPPAPAS